MVMNLFELLCDLFEKVLVLDADCLSSVGERVDEVLDDFFAEGEGLFFFFFVYGKDFIFCVLDGYDTVFMIFDTLGAKK
jgi:hypothetical protein